MKTTNNRLTRWSVRCGVAAAAVVFCASGFARPVSESSAKAKQTARNNTRKVCYTLIAGSAIPQPCDRLGPIPSTAIPMVIIGDYRVARR